MTRASKYEIDYSVLDTLPAEETDISRLQLEDLYRAGIDRELQIMRETLRTAARKRSRVAVKICAISNNTNSSLAFEKGAALLQLLDENGLTERYMEAPTYSISGGHADDWTATFDNPNGPGYFTIRYVHEAVEGESTHTQKLLFTAQN